MRKRINEEGVHITLSLEFLFPHISISIMRTQFDFPAPADNESGGWGASQVLKVLAPPNIFENLSL